MRFKECVDKICEVAKDAKNMLITAGQGNYPEPEEMKATQDDVDNAEANKWVDSALLNWFGSLFYKKQEVDDKINDHNNDGRYLFEINTIDDLQNVDTNTVTAAHVKDKNRGGVFVYDSSKSNINDDGIIFNGWVRRYDGDVNAKWFGAKGDGSTNDTQAIQKAIDYIKNNGLNNNFVLLENGTFIIDSSQQNADILIYKNAVAKDPADGETYSRGTNLLRNTTGTARIARGNSKDTYAGDGNSYTRDEFMIWGNWQYDTNGTIKSTGAGIHLYGLNDPKHTANYYVFTPNKDSSPSDRMIILGSSSDAFAKDYEQKTTTDTRAIIGNSPFSCQEEGEALGTLTLYNSVSNRPQLYFSKGGGDSIGLDNTRKFSIASYTATNLDNTPTRKYRMTLDNDGELKVFDPQGDNNLYFSVVPKDSGNDRFVKMYFGAKDGSAPHIAGYTNQDSGGQLLKMYVNNQRFLYASDSLYVLYANDDSHLFKIDRDNKHLRLPNLPTSDPNVSGVVWNDSGTLKISAG